MLIYAFIDSTDVERAKRWRKKAIRGVPMSSITGPGTYMLVKNNWRRCSSYSMANTYSA